jgi:hypothetical protein
LISWFGVLFCLTSPWTVDEVVKEIVDLFVSIYKAQEADQILDEEIKEREEISLIESLHEE